MKEKKSKKEWIKSIAIIFLIVLLVLTFFSNTIMNRSLPEVSAQYCYSGQVTNKVRGTGTVQANDPYSVTVKESRKIESVLVREGDIVEKGDVLYTLTDGESAELKAAMEELATARNEYELAIITGAITKDVTDSVEKNGAGSLETNQAKITAAKNLVETLEKKVKSIQNQIDDFNNGSETFVEEKKKLAKAEDDLKAWKKQNDIDSLNYENASSELDDIKRQITSKKADISAIEKELKEHNDVSSDDFNADEKLVELKTLKKELKSLESTKSKKQSAYDTAKSAYDYSTAMISVCEAAIEEYTLAITDKNYLLSKQLKEVQEKLEKAQEDYQDLLTELSTKYGLEDKLKVIQDKQAVVDELNEGSIGGTITSPVSGTVISTAYTAGQTIDVQNAPEVAKIQKSGDLYSLSMSIPNNQAQLINVGDEAEVSNSWYYSDVHARVTQIRPDQADPTKSKLIVFEVEGNDLTDGMSLQLTVGNRTANYDLVVPKSAVREDNNGKFVLKVTSKDTPLGVRYIAERVDVKVLAEDDTNSAISGNMDSWEFIITTTSKPVESGSQVRLKE